MVQIADIPEMAEPMKLVKVSIKSYDRFKKFGYAGESINTALERVLDIAEQHLEKKR